MPKTVLVFAVALVLLTPVSVGAHTPDEAREWQADWEARAQGGLTPVLLAEWFDFRDRHEPSTAPSVRTVRVVSVSPGVEQWRPLVEQYFQPGDVPWAMAVMQCESQGDPTAKNPSSSASGLYQHLASFWADRSAAAGWAGASIWDPEANVAVAAWLVGQRGGRSHWTCTAKVSW